MRADFVWSQASCIDADEATTGELRLFVGGRLAWGRGRHGVRWHWVDLLEGLAANWGELLYGGWLEPDSPAGGSVLRGLDRFEEAIAFDESGGDLDVDAALALHDVTHEWAEAHLLSRYMPGLYVPEIAIWSQTDEVRVETAAVVTAYPRAMFAEALSTLGDAIAERMRTQEFGAHDAVLNWDARRIAPRDTFAASVAGESPSRLREARGALTEAQAWGDLDGAMGDTSCLAAAAAARGAGQEALTAAVQAAAKLTVATEGWLECLEATRLAEQAAGGAAEAFALELASGVRGLLNLGPKHPLHLSSLTRVLGLIVNTRNWGRDGPAAIAIGAPGFSPGLLINADVAGQARTGERRWIAAAAIVGALCAGAAHQPWAKRFYTPDQATGDDRLVLELLVPGEGLIDFILSSDKDLDELEAACQHFGVPLWAIARQLGRFPGYLSTVLREKARAALQQGQMQWVPRYLRAVSA